MTAGLRHDALLYSSDQAYVEALAPFIAEGVRSGVQTCVVTRPYNSALLRDALGPVAADVRFDDATAWYDAPARTIAGYHGVLRDARAAGVDALRIVGEIEFGHSAAEHDGWARYESICNHVFADEPAWIVCPYDERRLPERVLSDARCTHTHEYAADSRVPSGDFVEPSSFVRPFSLEVSGALVAQLEIDHDLRPLRQTVAHCAETAGLTPDRRDELIVAVNELAANAFMHGSRPVTFRAWVDGPRLVIEVNDEGPGLLDPMAGFRPPVALAVGGAGLWLARQFSDELEIVPSDQGATVRVQVTA